MHELPNFRNRSVNWTLNSEYYISQMWSSQSRCHDGLFSSTGYVVPKYERIKELCDGRNEQGPLLKIRLIWRLCECDTHLTFTIFFSILSSRSTCSLSTNCLFWPTRTTSDIFPTRPRLHGNARVLHKCVHVHGWVLSLCLCGVTIKIN